MKPEIAAATLCRPYDAHRCWDPKKGDSLLSLHNPQNLGRAAAGKEAMKTLMRAFGLAALEAVAFAGIASAALSENGPHYALPSWDQQIPTASRFVLLTNWDSQAVLDRETGLVWQQNPFLNSPPLDTWNNAFLDCQKATTGGRFGWRLPSVEELLTLMDPTTRNVFSGDQFASIEGAAFWTATTNAAAPNDADVVTFQSGSGDVSQPGKDATFRLWCVRGYQGTQSPQ